jgi:serine/threonine protein kinase
VVGELIAERYELEELVGRGGMSSVYRAHDLLLDRRVAIKVLHERYLEDEDYVERFRREARAAAQLGHPNIVTVIDRGRSGGCEYIVFEYVEGENLKELVERCGPVPVHRALELGIQIGRALAFAHENGLVHRDVKPQNVLLANGQAKVTDFGIARSVDVHGLTETGTVLGTSDYIAPEQAQGLGASEASDVYSLGVVLYELLTGSVPYTGESFVQVAMRHVHDSVPSVLEQRPDVPVRVASAIERALEKDPARRFPSMRDFVAELRACIAALGADDRAPTLVLPREAPPRRERRRRLPRLGVPLLLLLAGLAAVAAAAGVYFVTRDGDTSSGSHATPPAAAATSVNLRAIESRDPPPGDGEEHPERVSLATDGDLASFWETEHYSSADFGRLKTGVGLVLDAGRPTRLPRLVVQTDTPGFTAVVQSGSSASGPFSSVSGSQTVGGTTTFTLRVQSPQRYYLLWITRLAPDGDRFQTHVNEVGTRAVAGQLPERTAASVSPSPSPASVQPAPAASSKPAARPGKGHGKAKGKKRR